MKLPYRDLSTGVETLTAACEIFDRLMDDIMQRIMANPLIMLDPTYFGKQIFAIDRHFFFNCAEIRKFIRSVIEEKKAKKEKDGQDVISLILSDPNYQVAEDIVDDVIVMFFAGSKTVQTTTSNLITSLLFEPEIFAKMRGEEVDPLMERVKDDILGKMTLKEVDDCELIKMCYMEAMRRNSPAAISSTACMSKDCNITGLDLPANQGFLIFINAIQNDPSQWREPELFKPERFDPASEWYKRPDGGKRNSHAFSPFLGGSRVCLGKTFAEVTLRFTIPLYYHFFDFELVEPAHKKERPVVWLGATKAINIPIKFITRNKVPANLTAPDTAETQ